MPASLSVPFAGKETSIKELPPIPFDTRTPTVANMIGGHLITINIDDLQAGDVVLFGELPVSGFLKRGPGAISMSQGLLFNQEQASWVHVGLIDQNYIVWDVMPGVHVRRRPLSDILRETRRIGIVRPCVYVDPNLLSASLLAFSNGAYSIFNVETGRQLAARFMRSGRLVPVAAAEKDFICTSFVSAVLRRTTKYGFFRELPIAVPADFAACGDFEPVQLHWKKVVAPYAP